LLLCSDGSYYCGIASNLGTRIRHHATGKGSIYTKGVKATSLVWYESHPDCHAAAEREKQIKRWRHDKKKELAEGGERFKDLGQRGVVSLG
jgi:putative endonuclease